MENTQLLALPAPAPLISEETLSHIKEVFSQLADAIVEAFKALKNAIAEAVSKCIIPAINRLMKQVYKLVAPPKLYHLAYYAKKGRTRKKNLKRIKRYFWREYHGSNKIHQ